MHVPSTPDDVPDRCVPDDHSRQVNVEHLVRHLKEGGFHFDTVIDLGCGEGNSVDFFRALAPHAKWVGVDIADSSEVALRKRADAEFRTYDGIHIPAEDSSVDLVFCRQVFEHVRHPEPLLRQVHRVLRPGGHLVLSASFLEPFHSRSIFGYTPYGFHLLLETAGLDLVELRPGVDGLTLMIRRLLGCPRFMDRWITGESPVNRIISAYARLRGWPHRHTNRKKLLICGHFCLSARKPVQAGSDEEPGPAQSSESRTYHP
ncbi:MAG: hypothetical protein AMXMBFR4_29120 [Candidatus Hydrogenedentota bacterium]